MRSVCRGAKPDVLDQMVAQAQFGVVRNGSKHGGLFVYFAGYIKADWRALPASMVRCWMLADKLWDLADAVNYLLVQP